MDNILVIIIWVAIIQGLLLGSIFIFNKKNQSFSNKILGFFLLAFVFQALTDISPFDSIGGYSLSGYFTLPEVKWLLPVLFLHFVLEKVCRSASYSIFLKIHYVLGFVMISLTIVNVLLFLFFNTSIIDTLGWGVVEPFYMGMQYYAFMLSVSAFVIALVETFRYRKIARNEFSDILMLNISWLWQYIFAIALIIVFWGAELVRIILGGMGQSEFTLISFIFIAGFNYFVSYKAFTHQNLFDGSIDKIIINKLTPINTDKSTISNTADVFEKIQNEIKQQEYYLIKNLTIHDLSEYTQIPVRTISHCINKNTGINFNEWINNYRVDSAVEKLTGENFNHLSIEGIGLEVGFKSRSAMYTAFQRKFDKTPGHFRKTLS